jgi:hypothetical protein
MLRLLPIAILLLLGGCSGAKQSFVLPQTAPGGWHLRETKTEGARTLAVYDGSGTVRVEVDDMKVPAVAFERAQKARPEPDTVFFDKDRFFVTVRWEKADREALKQLMRALQKQ